MEALNAAGVDSSSKLREPSKIMYPSALEGIASSSTLESSLIRNDKGPKKGNDKGPKEKKDKIGEPKEKEFVEQDFYNFM